MGVLFHDGAWGGGVGGIIDHFEVVGKGTLYLLTALVVSVRLLRMKSFEVQTTAVATQKHSFHLVCIISAQVSNVPEMGLYQYHHSTKLYWKISPFYCCWLYCYKCTV